MLMDLFKKKNYSLDADIIDFRCKFKKHSEGCVVNVCFSDGFKYRNSTIYDVIKYPIGNRIRIETSIKDNQKELLIHLALCAHYEACTGLNPIKMIEPVSIEKKLSISECVKIADNFTLSSDESFTNKEGFLNSLRINEDNLIVSPGLAEYYNRLLIISSLTYYYRYHDQKSYEPLIPELMMQFPIRVKRSLCPSEKELCRLCNDYWDDIKRDYRYDSKVSIAKYLKYKIPGNYGDKINGLNENMLCFASNYINNKK